MSAPQATPLLRRLAGILYDTFLAGAVVVLVAMITLFVLQVNGLGEVQPDSPLSHLLFAYYLFILFVYFSWFWTHGGQTPGMKVWKLRVENMQGGQINILESIARFGFALLLPIISQLWSLFDHDKLALHDKLSATRLVYIDS